MYKRVLLRPKKDNSKLMSVAAQNRPASLTSYPEKVNSLFQFFKAMTFRGLKDATCILESVFGNTALLKDSCLFGKIAVHSLGYLCPS